MDKISSSSRSKSRSSLFWGLLIFLTVMLYGGAWACACNTVVPAWIPAVKALVLALIPAFGLVGLWQRFLRIGNRWVCLGIHTVFFTGLLWCLYLFSNYWWADGNSLHTEQVSVERLYSEKHNRTRRVGRRTYTTGEVYYTYSGDMKFPNGFVKNISLTNAQYRRLHKGDSIDLNVAEGLFGMPVIYRRGANVEVPKSGYRHTR